MDNTIWVASFDIGKKNFAFCIEEINPQQLINITNIPKVDRYLKDRTCTPDFANVLKQVYTNGKLIILENIDLTEMGDCDKSQYLDPVIFVNMTTILDKYKEYWDKCTSIIIEQQMGFGKKRNLMAIKLGQHCFSYFLFQYALFKNVSEFGAYYKTKVNGAIKMSDYQRKKWAVSKAIDILTEREDFISIDIIKKQKKKDDMSDTIVQLQAYKYLVFVDKSMCL